MALFGQSAAQTAALPTGLLQLDHALGIGGLPLGRITEIWGPPSCGKTTLGLHFVAAAQALGCATAWIDADHAFPAPYSTKLGVNADDLLITQPKHGDQALRVVLHLLESMTLRLLVIDSAAGLMPPGECVTGLPGTSTEAHSELMTRFFGRIALQAFRSRTAVVVFNQLRGRSAQTIGAPEVPTGGMSIGLRASLRFSLQSAGLLQSGIEARGERVAFHCLRNRCAGNFPNFNAELLWGEGFARELDLFATARKLHLIEQNNQVHHFAGHPLGSRLEEIQHTLRTQPELEAQLRFKVESQIFATAAEKKLQQRKAPTTSSSSTHRTLGAAAG
jgi:recombination protein RecA